MSDPGKSQIRVALEEHMDVLARLRSSGGDPSVQILLGVYIRLTSSLGYGENDMRLRQQFVRDAHQVLDTLQHDLGARHEEDKDAEDGDVDRSVDSDNGAKEQDQEAGQGNAGKTNFSWSYNADIIHNWRQFTIQIIGLEYPRMIARVHIT